MADDDLPESLSINAWTGDGAPSTAFGSTWTAWATQSQMVESDLTMAAAEPVDERDWQDPRVGWGVVVADNDALSEADRALGKDLPGSLRELVHERRGPILRYRENTSEFLRRYYTDRRAQDLAFTSSTRGTGVGQLPKYLLIWGSPAQGAAIGCVPWRFQYLLNGPCYVGRLDLDGQSLDNYIAALRDNWNTSAARAVHPVIWASDHSMDDITHLMRRVIADQLDKKLRSDPDVGDNVRYADAVETTATGLIEALADPVRPPALIVTTSHGMTGPLNDPVKMAADLGLLVDQHGTLLRPDAVLARWNPHGAVWYAHACCSAGADAVSQYASLLADGQVKDVLTGVAALGARVAPFPRALLGRAQPLRAFIGHVEPTFDWTLRHPDTREPLTATLLQALYDGFYRSRPEPVGMAFRRVFEHVGHLFALWHQVRGKASALDPNVRLSARKTALRTQLAALDRQACVILGDPTAALPPLH